MTVPRHYENAPLTEALIDIRVRLPDDVSVHSLVAVQSGEKDRYPARSDHIQIVSELRGHGMEQVATATQQSLTGFVFTSADERQLFQARLDGFTFNRLHPYEQWESFREEARRLWNLYRAVARPREITRVAVRYINRIDVPFDIDFREYLRTVPEISPDISQALSGFFMRLEIPQPDIDGMLILHEALIPPPRPDMGSIALDIDLFRQVDMPVDEDALWAILEQLRERKNAVFEACITERTREMISY